MKFDYDNAQVGLLGTLMLGAFDDAVSDGITEEWFDGLKNKSVWTLINRIYLNSEKPNMDFMSIALADSEWSGKVGELIPYIDSAPTKHNYPYWKEICHENGEIGENGAATDSLVKSHYENGENDAAIETLEKSYCEIL